MKTVVICCETLKNELNTIFQQKGISLPVIWISSDYHNNPAILRKKLQSEIDGLDGYDRIFLGFGCCGNSTIGLTATTAEMIIPKANDCIDILLSRKDKKLERKIGTYFLSKGWLQSATKGIINEHQQLIERYGEEKAQLLLKTMLNQYYFLMFIDSGVSDGDELNHLLEISEKFASAANLELVVEKGLFWLLQALVEGPWEEDFIVIKKGETVPMTAFMTIC